MPQDMYKSKVYNRLLFKGNLTVNFHLEYAYLYVVKVLNPPSARNSYQF